MTKEELLLWDKLRNRSEFPEKWRRQHPILFYVADFYCHELRLIIEVDGKDHDRKIELDLDRTEKLNAFGIKVVRFKNDQVNNEIEEIIHEIKLNIRERKNELKS